ncbi:major royal jelly protein-domain-containing protein [Xylogone sp. PMI_703]|nr:major royal jelly protein-domain-containing protein [Xylogone sp. PMI_703]
MKTPALFAVSLVALTTGQTTFPYDLNTTFTTSGPRNVRRDAGTYGPAVEEVHYYYDQWPIGISVSRRGRIFACYTRGTYNYTLGEISNLTAEVPYPNAELNSPPGGLANVTNGLLLGSADRDHFISVQALFNTPDDRLWVLDTGRPTVNQTGTPAIAYAAPGGPKLVAINLTTNSIERSYYFPSSVHYPDSYMNDIRFDLRPNVTESGQGLAYIVDSSNEGRNGFIILDLGTGESWRHLTQNAGTLRINEDVPSYNGIPSYVHQRQSSMTWQSEGLDGIELSADGEVLFFSPLTGDFLYSVETKYLRVNPSTDPLATVVANDNVKFLGGRGGNANGFSGDSNGNVYMLMPEHNAIYIYNSTTHQTIPYVRDPRIIWPDSANAGWDGYLYYNINQLPYQADWNNGVDGRQYPGLILRSKLVDGATKGGLNLV